MTCHICATTKPFFKFINLPIANVQYAFYFVPSISPGKVDHSSVYATASLSLSLPEETSMDETRWNVQWCFPLYFPQQNRVTWVSREP